MVPKSSVLLLAALASGAVLAQTSLAQEVRTSITPDATSSPASTAPVAYVYVTRPTHLDGFAVSSGGTLTPVPGSPFAGISLYHLSVTRHYATPYLIGGGDDAVHIFTYAIDSKGSVKQVDSVNGQTYSQEGPGDCCGKPEQLDASGQTLYNMTDDTGDMAMETFHIESNGHLQFIGNTSTNGGGTNYEPGMISFLQTNKFAYDTGCNTDVTSEQLTGAYKRESSGLLQGAPFTFQLPQAKEGDVYCPEGLTTDPSNHLAFFLQQLHQAEDEGEPDGPVVLASYTSDANGNLTTTNTTATMPALPEGSYSFSISPSGKLLAVAVQVLHGGGFELYHFNGGDPITPYTGFFHTDETFIQFAWDKSNHLYALSTNALHIYSATSTKVTEEPGSPISIPEASSLIVMSN